jgi:hypothetical protein
MVKFPYALNVSVQLAVTGCCFFLWLCTVVTIYVHLSVFRLGLGPLDAKTSRKT